MVDHGNRAGDGTGELVPPPDKDFVPRLGAGCLVLLGGLVAVIAVTIFLEPGRFEFLGFLFYGILGLGFSGAGIFWYRYVTEQEETRRHMFEEKAILNVAARHGGYATLAQISLATPFTASEAEAAMSRLCRQGYAQPELLEDGTIRYRFGGLLGSGPPAI